MSYRKAENMEKQVSTRTKVKKKPTKVRRQLDQNNADDINAIVKKKKKYLSEARA